MAEDLKGVTWRRGRLCADSACVEVAAGTDRIYLRDSKDPDGATLGFTRAEWAAFLGSAKEGDFDDL